MSVVDLTAEVNRGRDVRRVYYPVGRVMESITAPKAVIPVHQARSHDEFRPPDLNFTVSTPPDDNCLADGRLR